MPWYGFIHPLTAVLTLAYGIRIAQESMTKVEDWDFPVRRIRNRTVLFAVLSVLNVVLGFVFNAILSGRGQDVQLTAHLLLGIVTVLLALLAAIVTFTRSRKPGELSPLMRFHGWIIAVALAAVMTMGFIGVLKLFES